MMVRIKGVYAKRKQLASGQVQTYYYHRASRTRLPGDPGSLEFRTRVEALNTRRPVILPAAKTFADLLREYRASMQFASLGANTRAEYARHMKYLEPVFADHPVASIRPIHVEKLMQKYLATPTLGKAIARTLSILLSYACHPLGWIASNPLIGRKASNAGRRRPVVGQRPCEEHEIAAFRARNSLGGRARLAFEIALGIGLRREGLCNVLAAAMNETSFGVATPKGGDLVIVPVTAAMRESYVAYAAARQAAGLPPSRFALCSERGGKLHKRTVAKDLSEACDAAGFDPGQRLHALRYTAATRLLEAGCSYYAVQELTVGSATVAGSPETAAARRAA